MFSTMNPKTLYGFNSKGGLTLSKAIITCDSKGWYVTTYDPDGKYIQSDASIKRYSKLYMATQAAQDWLKGQK
jgi:hypothetical protein